MMMNKILSILLLGLSLAPVAKAAQVGSVIVDQASVYEYPQAGSNVVSTLSKDQSIAVSNIPTEGFYKVRLPNGDLGWISGNDVYVGKGPAPTQAPARRSHPKAKAPDALREDGDDADAPRPKKKKKRAEDEEAKIEDADTDTGDDSRILLMLGVQYPAYDGFKQLFVSEGLNPGYGGVLEFQFQMSKHLHWAARAEFNFARVPSKVVDAAGTTQELKQSSIPLQVGLNFSPFTSKGFRLGLGVYGGMALSSTLSIAQTSGTVTQQLDYSSVDPTGLGVIQMAIGLGTHIAIVAEGGYRYQKTGALSASSLFGGVPSIKIDYSGPVGHAGFEFKF